MVEVTTLFIGVDGGEILQPQQVSALSLMELEGYNLTVM